MNLNKPELNLIKRLDLPLASTDQERTNPHTGATCRLVPLAAALYDFIYHARADGDLDSFQRPPRITYLGRTYKIRDWDRARMLFLRHFSYEYNQLID